MTTQIQRRRGTTAQHSTFTGAEAELTVDTTKDTVVVHDGSTVGGRPLLREDQSNLPTSAPTTGIYNASGSLAISTNGTGRLFVDASGRVGVNTASPQRALHLVGSDGPVASFPTIGAKDYLVVENNSNANISIVGGATSGSSLKFFASGNNSPFSTITSDYTNGNLALVSNSSVTLSTASSERLRITSAGLVGVGTSSPTSALEVNGTITIGTGGTQTYQAGVIGYTDANWGCLSRPPRAGAIGAYGFQSFAGTTRMVITDDGKVGVGTTSPGYALTVSDGTRAGFIQPSSGLGSVNFGVATNHPMVLVTNDQERARIDASGRFLVGTSSASAADATIIAQGNAQNSTFGSRLYLARGEATPADGAGLGNLNFSDSTHTVSAMIRAVRDGGTWSGSSKPTRLEFSTTADGASSPTERMRISNNGTHAMYGLDDILYSSTNRGAGTTYATYVGRYGATSTTTGTISFLVFSNGNVQNTNNSYGAYSDVKLKENIVDAGSQWDDLKALQVRKYNFKEGQTHTQIGLVAQEVELVSPGLVTESPDRDAEGNDLGTVTKSVNYSVLYMKAVKALQEAMERIEVLEQRLTDAGIA